MPKGLPKGSKLSEHAILAIVAGVSTALVLAFLKLSLDKTGNQHISKRM